MNKEFSEGFIHDLADILDECIKNNTDHAAIDLEFGDLALSLDITFTVKQAETADRKE